MKFYIFILIFFFYGNAYGQKKNDRELERDKLSKLFFENFVKTHVTDTNAAILFAVKINILKKGRKYLITSMTLSDSTAALKFYNNFKFLKEIDFVKMGVKKRQATLVFPVGIFLFYPNKDSGKLGMFKLIDDLKNYWFVRDYLKDPIEDYIYYPLTFITTSSEDI